MSGPKRNPDKLNTIGVVVVGICGAVLVYVTIIALQAFYMGNTAEIQTTADYGGQDLTAKGHKAGELRNITVPAKNAVGAGQKPTFHIPIDTAMKLVVESAKQDPAHLIPALPASDKPTIAPLFGRPQPATPGSAAPAVAPEAAGSAAPDPAAGATAPTQPTAATGQPQPGAGAGQPASGTTPAHPATGANGAPGARPVRRSGAAAQPKATGAAQPKAGTAQPKAGAAQPKAGAAQPKAGAAQPKAGAAQPKAGSAQPKAGSAQPRNP